MLSRKLHDRSPIVDFVNKQALAMFENQARKGLLDFDIVGRGVSSPP